jgi:hypothetical protein
MTAEHYWFSSARDVFGEHDWYLPDPFRDEEAVSDLRRSQLRTLKGNEYCLIFSFDALLVLPVGGLVGSVSGSGWLPLTQRDGGAAEL